MARPAGIFLNGNVGWGMSKQSDHQWSLTTPSSWATAGMNMRKAISKMAAEKYRMSLKVAQACQLINSDSP